MKRTTANLQQVKGANQNLVFGHLYSQGPLSRADLTVVTRLSPTTVSSLVEGLIGEGLVEEQGLAETRTSGRKPRLLAILPRGRFVLSAELTRNGFELGLFDLRCELIGSVVETVAAFSTIGPRLIQASEKLVEGQGLDMGRLGGVCVGAPALIDPRSDIVIDSTVLPMEEKNDFMAILRGRFPGVPVRLDNESGLCGYAEKEYGAMRGLRDIIYIDINVGIGAGIILNGDLHRGSANLAGEIGHLSLDINGPRCGCGNRGCMEMMANVPALVGRVIQGLESGRESVMRGTVDGNAGGVDLETIRLAAQAEDSLALEAIDETARYLASGINSAMNLLDPEMVIIGGSMAELGDPLFDRIEEHLSKMALKGKRPGRRIRRSEIRGGAAILGGARLLVDGMLRQPELGHAVDE